MRPAPTTAKYRAPPSIVPARKTRAAKAPQPGIADDITTADLVGSIVKHYRIYRALSNAVGDMTRRIKSAERWYAIARVRAAGGEIVGRKFPPVTKADSAEVKMVYPAFYLAKKALMMQKAEVEEFLKAQVRALPIWPVWQGFGVGLAEISLAMIIGEAGDIGTYKHRDGLVKRMCLHVEADGRAARRHKDADKAKAAGYSPRRRATMYVIGSNLIMKNNPTFKPMYDARKAFELERSPKMTKGHAAKRAQRYIETKLLRRLYRSWRHLSDGEKASARAPERAKTFPPLAVAPLQAAAE